MLAAFAWDNKGRRSGLTSGGMASTFGYDPAGRLSSLAHNLGGTAADQTIGLAYNPAGQILTRSGTNDSYAWNGAVAVNRPYSVNGQNQYTAAGGATFAYDANGNLISDGATTFLYDVENRLVSASGAKTAALVYDPLGRLFQTSGGSAGITQFLYDDDALIGEYDSAGGMPHRYLHGPAKGVDDPLIWYHNSAEGWRRALVSDQLGSVIAVADMYGNPVAINAYDEYGIPSSGNQGRFQYTGQAWIPELGMYYYKARIYSPTLGRFLQVDPIGYDDQINLYAYVGNDPISNTDPTGTCRNSTESRLCAVRAAAAEKAAREIRAAREQGVRAAWRAERQAVANGGGSRNWTRAERAELLKHGKVSGYEGHHINTVKGNPLQMARDPRNIQFVTGSEHAAIHRRAGGFRQPITGQPLITRSYGLLSIFTMGTGMMSGRIRTDSLDNFYSDMVGLPSTEDVNKENVKRCGSPLCA